LLKPFTPNYEVKCDSVEKRQNILSKLTL